MYEATLSKAFSINILAFYTHQFSQCAINT